MSFLNAKKLNRHRGLQSVWDGFSHKVVLHVVSGQSLHHPTKAASAKPVYSIKVFYGDDEIEKISNNVPGDQTLETDKEDKVFWNSPLLLLPGAAAFKNTSEIFIAVYEKKGLRSDRFCGKCSLGSVSQLFNAQRDVVHTMPLQLQIWGSSSSKRSKGVNPNARITVRLLLSEAAETRPMGQSASALFDFPYKSSSGVNFDNVKTGDLIAFSGHGVLPAAVQVLSNKPYSSVGMAVRLQNKYTFLEDVYVLEFTRNIDSLLDSYRDVPLSLTLVRLKDRLHQFHGTSIFHVPLGTPLYPEEQQHLIELVCDLHNTQAHPSRDTSSATIGSVLSFLGSSIFFNPKTSAQVAELYSPIILVRLLHQATCVRPQQERPPLFSDLEKDTIIRVGSPGRLVTSSCFLAPIPLRTLRATKSKRDLRRQYSVYQPGTDLNNLHRQPRAGSRTELEFPRGDSSPLVQPATPQRQDGSPDRVSFSVAATSAAADLPYASAEPVLVTFDIAKKTPAHWAYGEGSEDCFVVQGHEGPILTLTIDHEYIFHIKAPGHSLYLTRNRVGGPVDAANHRLDIWEDSTDQGRFLFIPSYAMPDRKSVV